MSFKNVSFEAFPETSGRSFRLSSLECYIILHGKCISLLVSIYTVILYYRWHSLVQSQQLKLGTRCKNCSKLTVMTPEQCTRRAHKITRSRIQDARRATVALPSLVF